MEVRAQEASQEENRAGHVQCDERRVEEMERHVKCLREKLCRLEKMLPLDPNAEAPRHVQDTCSEPKDGPSAECPVDGLAKKEKSLREQIHEMERTEQAYVRRIAGTGRSRKDVQRERLCLLESYSQKLCNNLRSLNDNRAGLTREAQNLAHVLEKTRRKDAPAAPSSGCECKVAPKCNSCVVCSCDEWERDLGMKKGTTGIKDTQCSCHDSCSSLSSSSSSDSETSCQCQRATTKAKENIKSCPCKCDQLASTDYSSDDDQTCYSERSKFTCFCSKNHSHEDLWDAKTNVKQKKVERCRGGLDTLDAHTAVVSFRHITDAQKNTFPNSLSNAVVDNFRFLKVDELREGLERLKIRNRNLKDFLQNLESPVALIGKSSEIESLHAASSSSTVDLAKQTRSCLLNVIDALEGRCRRKDAVIVALSDELKINGRKKLYLPRKELNTEKAQVCKSLSEGSDKRRRATGGIFATKESAIGFLILLVILVSHAKRFEVAAFFSAAKKITAKTLFRIVMWVGESEKLSTNYLIAIYWRMRQLFQDVKRFHLSLLVEFGSFLSQLYEYVKMLDWRPHYLLSGVCVVVLAIVIIKFKKIVADHLKIPNSKRLVDLLMYARSRVRVIFQKVSSSKVFWLTFGFGSHVLWGFFKDDLFESANAVTSFFDPNGASQGASLKNPSGVVGVSNEGFCQQLARFDYFWLASAFTAQLRGVMNFVWHALENVMR